jgi:hypothetical protein
MFCGEPLKRRNRGFVTMAYCTCSGWEAWRKRRRFDKEHDVSVDRTMMALKNLQAAALRWRTVCGRCPKFQKPNCPHQNVHPLAYACKEGPTPMPSQGTRVTA